MFRPLRFRLRDLLAVTLVVLAVSPFTAPFSTYDLTSHRSGTLTHEAEILTAKLATDEDLAVVGTPPAAETAAPVFLLVAGPTAVDETSKHQIPSGILRL